MPSKQQDPAPSISPVLFLNEDGEPMSFFLRPGPIKRKLQPLISAGGGILCKTQQPGAILLIAEEERSVPESAAHRYVSTKFIYDSIEKEEQLNIEDYKLDPEVAQTQNPGLNKSKDSSARSSGGRMTYTPEEDAAILHYVSKRKKEIGGNRLWQEMEKKRVTNHSWQSMKHRYREQLKTRQSEDLEVEAREDGDETAKMEANQGCDADKSSCEADVAHHPSADSDLTQIDVQATAAGCTLENKDPQAAVTAEMEERQDQEVDEQPCVEATMSPSTQTENSNLQLRTAEGGESERDEPQTKTLQKLNLHKNSPAAQPKAGSTSKSLRMKLEASPRLEQPQRRISRRRLGLEALSSSSSSSPEPFAKKLRSSSSSAEQATSSPQLSKKTKSTRESAPQKSSKDQPPLKRSRESKVGAESRPEQSGSDSRGEPDQSRPHSDGRTDKSGSDSEPKLAQADEMNSEPQKGGKRKEKRTLGILELARNEFEDDSESDEDPDRPETATTSAEPLRHPRDTPAGPTPAQSHPDTRTHPQEDEREGRVSVDYAVSDVGPSDAAPAEKNCSGPVAASSKAHLFIFDSESQEDDSQFVAEPSAAQSKPRPTVVKDAPFSLTQVQVEEDKRRIRDLIDQTNQDLVSVTKALLKASGDFTAALDLLLNPSVSALIWDPHDDHLLLSADPDVRQKLLEKYGEGNVAKRIVFLEVDR